MCSVQPSTSNPGRATRNDPVATFLDAQQRVLDRYQVAAERRYVEVATTRGQAQVLVAGKGPPLTMVIGGAVPAVCWAPLMARLPGRRLYAIELPGFGLTEPAAYEPLTVRRMAVGYLTDVLDALGLPSSDFVTQSMGAQWTAWLAMEAPARVRSQVMVGCPAFFLDTSAVLLFRLASVPGIGRALMSVQKPSTASTHRLLRMVGEDPTDVDELRDVLLAAQRLPTYVPSLLSLMRSMMRWTLPRREIVTSAAQLRGVRHPVRLVWGRQDTFGTIAAGRRIAAHLPDADLHVVEGGHAPWFHHGETVAALTREFLEALP